MTSLHYLKHDRPDRFTRRPGQKTMKAVVTTALGGYQQLHYRTVPIPRLMASEVLIQVLAAAVNNTDINTRLGWYSDAVETATDRRAAQAEVGEVKPLSGGWNGPTAFPLIQGTDCCGRVVAVADDVTRQWISRRVLVRPCMRLNGFESAASIWMGSDFDGAFAQYVAVPVSEVFALNSDWSDAELATIPCAYGTAENMLQRAKVRAADRLLVTGASGGVGSATVQLARQRGAQVTAVVGESKVAQVSALGVDAVITRGADYLKQLGENSQDVIIDNVAGEEFVQMLKLLKPGGRYVSSGAIAGAVVRLDLRHLYLKDIQLIGCTTWGEAVFRRLITAIEKNRIRPLLAGTFALEEIALVQKQFLNKQHVGKFVLLPPVSESEPDE